METCPRDGEGLTAHKTAQGRAIRCGTCAGLWLSGTTVVRHIGQIPRPAFVRDKGSQTSLHCPEDQSRLVAVMHHGVEIDACTSCGGVWLDQGELEKILLQRNQGSALRRLEDAANNAESISDGSELSSEALSAVMEFIGELFSGL